MGKKKMTHQNCINGITTRTLKSPDRPCTRNTRLLHDKRDVRIGNVALVFLLPVVLYNSRFLASHRCRHRHVWSLELLSSLLLRLRTEILDLGLAENDVGVRSRALEDVWVVDDEQNLKSKVKKNF